METARSRSLILAFLAIATAYPALGCGSWFEEEPPRSLQGDLDRLPAKTLGKILLETRTGNFRGPRVSPAEVLEVVARIGEKDSRLILARIDRFIARARANYSTDSALLKALYDVRDVLTASGPSDVERKTYAEWRLSHEPEALTTETAGDHAAGDPLRPHKLYLEGAARFLTGDREECRAWFEEIVKAYPNHPRAETARFLLARCDLWNARYTGTYFKKDEQDQRDAVAESAFRDYLKLYPDGRYAADARGWLGGLLWNSASMEALELYIAQFEDAAHPECATSSAHMIEKSLARMVAEPAGSSPEVLKLVARHPRVAQAAVYYVLNSPEISPDDGKLDEPALLRKWRLRVLPELAAAVSGEQEIYQGEWALRLKAMLAQAASAVGDQETALKLTGGMDEGLKTSDDLAFARLVALQRAGQPADAVKAANRFLRDFPESPLRAAVPLRLAQALVDEHRAGEAYLQLCLSGVESGDAWHGRNNTVYPPGDDILTLSDSAVYPDVRGTDATEDLKETLLNLAPLKELEEVVNKPRWNEIPEAHTAFKRMLAARTAARGDFIESQKYIEDLALQQRTSVFIGLQEATKQGTPDEQARAKVALGDAFAAAWMNPGDEAAVAFHGGASHLALRENAPALGFAHADEELESRNLMRHAIRWWLEGGELVKALNGLRTMAMGSDYEFTRAMETDAAGASKQLYQEMLERFPDALAAKEAAYWSFPPCPPWGEKDPRQWRYPNSPRGADDSSRDVKLARNLGGYDAVPYDAFGKFQSLREYDEPANEETRDLVIELNGINLNSGGLSGQFPPQRVADLFKQSLAVAENGEQVKLANLFEDLSLFDQVPGIQPAAREAYLKLRLRAAGYPLYRHWSGEPDTRPKLEELFVAARTNPQLAAANDFIDYAELHANRKDAGAIGQENPIYPDDAVMAAACRAFLEKHPSSLRREACHMKLMQIAFRTVTAEGSPLEPLEREIAAYQKSFPEMRYAAEVHNLRGFLAWRNQDFGTALDLTIAQLDDLTHLDLRREAAIRLASIFGDLGKPARRQAVMVALRTRPEAMVKLKAYIACAPEHLDHPLRCLGTFLDDQLALAGR